MVLQTSAFVLSTPACSSARGLAHSLSHPSLRTCSFTRQHVRLPTAPLSRTRRAATITASSDLLLSQAPYLVLSVASPAAIAVAKVIAGPGINIFNFVMIIRIILTWYPKTDLAKAPWIFIAVPTEPLLKATRKVIQPVGGVDISPIVWFALMSFIHEILVGPQGILVLLSQK